MTLYDRILQKHRADLDKMLANAEYQANFEEKKLLDPFVIDIQLEQFRSSYLMAIAARRRTEQQCSQAQSEVDKWQRRAKLALQKGDENLARLALERKKGFVTTTNRLNSQLQEQTAHVDSLKRRLSALEGKVSQVKEQLQSTVGRLGTSSAMAAFERMEEKVLMQEARAQSAQELIGSDLERQFAQLESGSGVDDELAALKKQMSLGPATSANTPSLPQATEQSSTPKSNEVVDAEIEQLRKQLDNL